MQAKTLLRRMAAQTRHHTSGTPQPPPEAPLRTAADLLAHLSILLRIGATAYLTQTYIANSTISVGPSMQPTLNPTGDVLLTEYLTPRLRHLRRGDVVVSTKPTDPRVSILKRVRGLPGDVVSVTCGDERLSVRVPRAHVWLEGDNKAQSTDSREYGAVPLALVRGRVVGRFWPLRQMCWMGPLRDAEAEGRGCASADCEPPR